MSNKKSKITITKPEEILDWAFRYAVTRHSYVVDDVIEEILINWEALSEVSKKRYIEEIKKHPNYDLRWNRVLEKQL